MSMEEYSVPIPLRFPFQANGQHRQNRENHINNKNVSFQRPQCTGSLPAITFVSPCERGHSILTIARKEDITRPFVCQCAMIKNLALKI